MAVKKIRFNAFTMNSTTHQSPGLWRHPQNRSGEHNSIEYWQNLARLLEKGLFDAVFIADVMGVYDVYKGNAQASIKGGVQFPVHDPLLIVPLMAAVTQNLGFGVTFSLTYEHPFPFARRMSTLDHLTNGRVGWNIVTGYLDSAARSLGLDKQLDHDQRYDLADEYLEVLYKLWEHSWEDEAIIKDPDTAQYLDATKIHKINHQGEYFTLSAYHLTEPSPQRTPVLFQAGTSARGRTFSAKHAECVFISGPTKSVIGKMASDLRESLLASGRSPHQQLIYAQALLIVDVDPQRAREKLDDYIRHIDFESAISLLSGWTGLDLSDLKPDQVIEYIENNAGRSALASFTRSNPNHKWTVAEAVKFIGLGGRGPIIVGSPTEVADQLEEWIDETGVDGFNLTYGIAPGDFSAVIELLIPELQRRGRYPQAYSDGTLRHKLFGQGSRIRNNGTSTPR